jgi:hypothetical protein
LRCNCSFLLGCAVYCSSLAMASILQQILPRFAPRSSNFLQFLNILLQSCSVRYFLLPPIGNNCR